MAKFHSLEEAQAYFQGDRFASGNGITLEALSEERSAAGMVLRDNHRNALGGVMGGAIFTLADFASAAAVPRYCIFIRNTPAGAAPAPFPREGPPPN